MVLKLYGRSTSTCTRTVATVLYEKQVPYEFVLVDIMKGEHKEPAYLGKQPFGQVPYIDDDGFILYESRAICRYIVAKYPSKGPALIPEGFKAKALFEQAASIEQSNFYPYASGAVAEMLFKPLFGKTPDPAVFDKNISTLEAKLDAYEVILGKQKYLAGNEVTLADLWHLPFGSMLPAAGSNILESKPNVARWFKDISSRPSWLAVKDGAKTTTTYE